MPRFFSDLCQIPMKKLFQEKKSFEIYSKRHWLSLENPKVVTFKITYYRKEKVKTKQIVAYLCFYRFGILAYHFIINSYFIFN